MFHLNIKRAAPRPKIYLVDTVDFEDDTKPKDLGLVGLNQGNDYGAGRNKAVNNKCRNEIKNLKKCRKRHGGSKRKCRKRKKKADKCKRENKKKYKRKQKKQEEPAQDTTQGNDHNHRACVLTNSCFYGMSDLKENYMKAMQKDANTESPALKSAVAYSMISNSMGLGDLEPEQESDSNRKLASGPQTTRRAGASPEVKRKWISPEEQKILVCMDVDCDIQANLDDHVTIMCCSVSTAKPTTEITTIEPFPTTVPTVFWATSTTPFNPFTTTQPIVISVL